MLVLGLWGLTACSEYDFKRAQTHQFNMAKLDWGEHADWVKNLKNLITIGLKK